MNTNFQHIDWANPQHVLILTALDTIVSDAYPTTRREMVDKRFSKRVTLTAFPQYLFHNMLHEAEVLSETEPRLGVTIRPHVRESGYHVVAMIEDLIITISAVQHSGQRPRYAAHRAQYAGQMSFAEVDGYFVQVPFLEDTAFRLKYVQLLHGPEPGDRQKHGFSILAFMNERGEYLPEVIDLRQQLKSIVEEHGTVETVHEELGLRFVPQLAKSTEAP